MTISVPATVSDESQVQNLFPLGVILAKPLSSAAAAEGVSSNLVQVHPVTFNLLCCWVPC